MDKGRILAIEDDEGVCRLLRHSLAREDYEVRIAHTGEEGLVEAFEDPPDLFLLDLELPGMDGLSVCQELKQNPLTRSLPVIILSGKGEESDVVQGLEIGADDYIVKPFSPKILNARLQAVLRRRSPVDAPAAAGEIFEFGPLVVDTRNNSIKVFDKDIDLSFPEYHFALLLICFLTPANRSEGCPQIPPNENPVSVIGQEGMILYSENRLGKLLPILEGLISVEGVNAAVLSAFYGLALLDSDPELGLQHLVDAEQMLQAESDPRAELVVLSFLIFYHVVFDGDERRASRYLSRAETLNKAVFDKLTVYSRVAVAQNLAIGRSFLMNDFDGANGYLEIAEALAEDRGLVNLVVLNRLVKISECYIKGDQDAMLHSLEECQRFVNHPQVKKLHKALLKLLQLKYYAQLGNFVYLQLQEKFLREEFKGYFGKASMAAGQLIVCQLETLHFQGRHEEAFQLSSDALQDQKVVANDLVRPLLNGFRALSAAVCADKAEVTSAIEACRAETGEMTFRQAFSKLLCARALRQIGDNTEAELTLNRISPVIEKNGWVFLALQLRAQLLLLQHDNGHPDDTDSIAALMADMEERSIWHLQSLVEDDYRQLYTLARVPGKAGAYAADMLRKRLKLDIDENGESYPRLQLSTLGGLKMTLGGEIVARTEEFSRTQRECLAMLSAAPDFRLPQEEVQLTFWPDKSPEKARSTLDTMLSRLRKILKEKLQPYPVKKYLKLQKGVLSFESVEVDSVEVVADIGRAREHVRRREYWQAEATYAIALSRWHGQFMPGSSNADQAAVYAGQLQQLCLDASLEWSTLLNDSGQTGRSIEVLTHALNMDRCNESIMKALYRSHMRDGNIAMAHQLQQKFEKVMKSEGYGPSEIARVLATFKTSEKI